MLVVIEASTLFQKALRNASARTDSKHRNHCTRRPREDDAGRLHAAPDRRLPRQRDDGRPRDGHERARAGEGHHDSRQEHGGHVPGREDQHRRYAGTRGFRRRGGARAAAGGRRAVARRCGGGAAAADAVRARQGAGARAAGGGRGQQGRPAGRAAGGSARRYLCAVH